MQTLIVVSQAPYKESSLAAFEFGKALLQAKHTLSQVFFTQDGVLHSSKNYLPEEPFPNLKKLWQDLSVQHKFPLVVCKNSVMWRGIVPDDSFSQLGMSHLFSSCDSIEKVIRF
ncbi:MAG: sulfurtransferase TusD [Legionellales bacterium]|nr:MAG: sulfurtransferase TusD [Legionellales bacterium]